MSSYQRFALVFDSDRSELGRAAVRLLELGVDVLYANDLDEAELLARQEADRLGAVLTPVGLDPATLDALARRICPQLAAGPRALVLTGESPDTDRLAALAAYGTEWVLWEPYDERDLRFVLTAAMSIGHAGERRKDLRVPTQIPSAVFMGRHRKDAVVHDLSLSGAYLAADHPFLEGNELSIDIALPTGPVRGKAFVVNARSTEEPGRGDLPAGMGITFTRLAAGASDALREYVMGRIRRFRMPID